MVESPSAGSGLGPRTVADLLDEAFDLLTRRPREILVITASCVVPLSVLTAYIFRDFSNLDIISLAGSDGSADGLIGETYLLLFLSLLLMQLVTVAIAELVTAEMAGEGSSLRRAAARAASSWWRVLVSWTVVKLMQAAGMFAFGLGALVVTVFAAVVTPALAIEGLGPFAAIGRSFGLVARRFWTVLGVVLLVALVSEAVGAAFVLAPELVAEFFGVGGWWWIDAAAMTASSLVVTPFVSACAVLLYLDLRVRTEALDLVLRSRDLAA